MPGFVDSIYDILYRVILILDIKQVYWLNM